MTTITVKQAGVPRRAPQGRRLHVVPRPAPRPEPRHPGERRMRDAGGPDDRATYSCGWGALFVASVSTSVRCPRCDNVQAW
jgi:hypothetical protein